MPEYEDKPLSQIAGYAAGKPEVKNGTKGDFVSFSVAVTRFYGMERDDRTRWYRIGVNDPQVQAFCLANIRKGTPVVLEGGEYTTEYQGQTQYNLSAFRVGLVTWFVKGTATPAQEEDEDL
jgi:single-stranded DNA-binding protein